MDRSNDINIKQIRLRNRPEYTKTRLCIIFSIIFALAFCAGAWLNCLPSGFIPSTAYAYIEHLFISAPARGPYGNFIYEIINNSVDIFEILFIIMLIGFTYVSGVLNRAAVFVTGLFYGFSSAYCIDVLLNYDVNTPHAFLTALLILKIFSFSSALLYCCVTCSLYSDVFGRYRNPYQLMKSDCFWGYILKFIIVFGYIIITEALYRLIWKIIL